MKTLKLLTILSILISFASCSTQTEAEQFAELGQRKARVWDIERNCMIARYIDTTFLAGDIIVLRNDNPHAPYGAGLAYGVVR